MKTMTDYNSTTVLQPFLEFIDNSIKVNYQENILLEQMNSNQIIKSLLFKSKQLFIVLILIIILFYIRLNRSEVGMFMITISIIHLSIFYYFSQNSKNLFFIELNDLDQTKFESLVQLSLIHIIFLNIEQILLLIRNIDFLIIYEICQIIAKLYLLKTITLDRIYYISIGINLYFDLMIYEKFFIQNELMKLYIFFKFIKSFLLIIISYYKSRLHLAKYVKHVSNNKKHKLIESLCNVEIGIIFINYNSEIIFQNKCYENFSLSNSYKNELLEELILKCEKENLSPDLGNDLTLKLVETITLIRRNETCKLNEYFQCIYNYKDKFNESTHLFSIKFNEKNSFSVNLRISSFDILEFTIRDITPQVELEVMKLDVEQANFKSLYLAKTAHELKNPIFTIQYLSSEIERKVASFKIDENSEQIHYTSSENSSDEDSDSTPINTKSSKSNILLIHKGKQIKILGDYIISLIEDLNSVAKTTSKNEPIQNDHDDNFVITNIKKMARFCIEILKIKKRNESQQNNKNIEILLEIEPNIPRTITLREKTIKQILINLLSNSYKFTQRGKVILKIQRSEDCQIRFKVEDTGIGIPLEKQSKIFSPFTVISENEKYNQHGSGLGLLIVKSLVEDLGSVLNFQSKVGVGTSFWFDLKHEIGNERNFSREQTLRLGVGKSLILDKKLILGNRRPSDFENFWKEDSSSHDILIGRSPLSSLHNSNITRKASSINNLICFQRKSDNLLLKINYVEESKRKTTQFLNADYFANCNSMNKIEKKIIPLSKFSSKKTFSKFKNCNSLRIMITDDQIQAIIQIKQTLNQIENEILKDKNYNLFIEESSNGIEALYKIYQDYKNGLYYDLLMIDENMPYMLGSTCMSILKDLSDQGLIINHSKFISISGDDSPEKIKYYQSKGCEEIFPKPIRKNILSQIILKLISLKE